MLSLEQSKVWCIAEAGLRSVLTAIHYLIISHWVLPPHKLSNLQQQKQTALCLTSLLIILFLTAAAWSIVLFCNRPPIHHPVGSTMSDIPTDRLTKISSDPINNLACNVGGQQQWCWTQFSAAQKSFFFFRFMELPMRQTEHRNDILRAHQCEIMTTYTLYIL